MTNETIPTNSTNIPQEWITIKTLRTISGASLCCWLITLFFDLICFMPVHDIKLRTLLVLGISTLSSLILAINKVFSFRSANKKGLWILVIPNAMLIYIHALGFQVATKELAMTANMKEITQQNIVPTTKAGATSIFFFLSKQTSWIPAFELTTKTAEYESEKKKLQTENKWLRDSINSLNDKIRTFPPTISSKEEENFQMLSDSLTYYARQYRKCLKENVAIKIQIEELESRNRPITNNPLMLRDTVLIRRIEEKNALINKWNAAMQAMKMQKADMERIINGYMGDEEYYRKLFKLIPVK